jgi:hypothetical protein
MVAFKFSIFHGYASRNQSSALPNRSRAKFKHRRPVCLLEQSGPTWEASFYESGRFQRSDTAMITSLEYRQFARECTKWAVETDTDDARKSFLALAKDWTFSAMAADRVGKHETAS